MFFKELALATKILILLCSISFDFGALCEFMTLAHTGTVVIAQVLGMVELEATLEVEQLI